MNFTCTWSAEWFVVHPHIYPGFTGKALSLTHFPLEPGCEDYFFLDQVVADFEQGLCSILTDSIKTPELDTSLNEPHAITSSASAEFLCLVSTISDTSKLQLTPSIRSHKLWCQARVFLAPVSLATKMSASKLIYYFSSHPAAFEFQSSTSPDNSTLVPANRKDDQSLSEFRLAFVLLLMSLSTLSSSFLTSKLLLLILFPFYQILREELHLCQKCVNYLLRFMTFWTMLCPNELGTQLAF